jgi:hypothetical protein
MKKGMFCFTLLICISLIGCTININTSGQVDGETSIQMTLTSVANQYFQNQNQSAAIITTTPHAPLQPKSNSQQNPPLDSQSITITVTPTITPTPIPCLQIGKVVDVTLPDDTNVQPGASEMKTWRLTNKGSCTWDQSYSLVYQSGNLPVRNPVVALSHSVQPGETVEISVPIIAPQNPGTFSSNFLLRDGIGQTFGSGIGANQTFWVKITVPQPASVQNNPFRITAVNYQLDSGYNVPSAINYSGYWMIQRKCPINAYYKDISITADGSGSINLVEYFSGIKTGGYLHTSEIALHFINGGTKSIRFIGGFTKSGEEPLTLEILAQNGDHLAGGSILIKVICQ